MNAFEAMKSIGLDGDTSDSVALSRVADSLHDAIVDLKRELGVMTVDVAAVVARMETLLLAMDAHGVPMKMDLQ